MKDPFQNSRQDSRSPKNSTGFSKAPGADNTPDSFNRYLNYIGILVVVACVFVLGFVTGKIWGGSQGNPEVFYRITGSREDTEVVELDFDQFWTVWETLSTRYVEKDLEEQEMYYGAIKGMVDGVGDPVTIYLTPEETEAYEDGNAGKFEGIGAELGYENGNVVIVAPLEGSPAKEAGLKPGDVIMKVDGVDVTDENIFTIVTKIRGDKGTDVVITVARNGDVSLKDITVTRDEINVPSVTFEEMAGDDKDVAVVDLDRFTEASLVAWQKQWDSVMDEVEAEDPDVMILDMRGNPGGYFNAAVYAAGEFLDEGDLVAKQRDRGGNEMEYVVDREGRFTGLKLVVLVDEGSASASEILAGALQHHGRALVIGEPTYGKGTAQEIEKFADGSSLHITTLKWVLPDGRWLNPEDVVEPDKVVEFTDDDFTDGDDPQMDAALDSAR